MKNIAQEKERLYPLIDKEKNIRSLAAVATPYLLDNNILSLTYTFSFTHARSEAEEQEVHNYILENPFLSQINSALESRNLKKGNEFIEKLALNQPKPNLSKITLIKNAINNILSESIISFSDPALGMDEIINILPSEFILHCFIPKMAIQLVSDYELANSSLISTHQTLSNLLKVFEDLCAELSDKTAFYNYDTSLYLLNAEDCKNKILSCLLLQLNEKNMLSKICDYDPIYSYLLSLNTQEKAVFLPIAQKLSGYIAMQSKQSQAMKDHLEQFPEALFDNKNHPFYYWLKTVTRADQLKAVLDAYDAAFVKSKNNSVKPFVEKLLAQDPNLVFSFLNDTSEHIKGKKQDMTVECQIDILIALIRQGYFSPKLRSLTQYKNILQRVGSNADNLYKCYQNIENKCPEYAELFLQDTIAKQISNIEKWLAINHPEHISPKNPIPYRIIEENVAATQTPAQIISSPVIEDKTAKKIVQEPTSKTKDKALPTKSAIQKPNAKKASEKQEKPPAQRSVQHSKDHHAHGFFQTAQKIAKQVTQTLLTKAVTSFSPKEYLSWNHVVTGVEKPLATMPLQQNAPQSTKVPLESKETTDQTTKKSTASLESMDTYQDIPYASPSAKIELLMHIASSNVGRKTRLNDFLKEAGTDLIQHFRTYFKNLSRQELDSPLTINKIWFLLTSSDVPSEISKTLKNMLFFESMDENTYYISGKILECCHLYYSAAILYRMGNSSSCQTALVQLESRLLSCLDAQLIDFSAISVDKHTVLKGILLSQKAFGNFPEKILQTIIYHPAQTRDCLDALNKYFIVMLSLYESGWAEEKSHDFYTRIFNGLVHLLLNIKVLMPTISEHEKLGYIFCINLTHLLNCTFEKEFAMRAARPHSEVYTAARTIYFEAFKAECKRIGINVLPSDTHFAAYLQLSSFSESYHINIPEKMLHLGQFQAIISSSTCLNQQEFHATLQQQNKPTGTPRM